MCDVALTIGESLRRCYTEDELRRAVCLIALSSEITTARLSETLTTGESELGVDTDQSAWMTA
jgi:hypothetical protein